MNKKLNESPHLLKVFKSGQGDPVVVIHGQLSTHRYMQDVTAKLAESKTVYALDLLGFGASPRPKNAAYSINQHIASINKTIQEIDLKTPFILVGHSMGSQLSLAYANHYNGQVKALVIVGLPLFESKETAASELVKLYPSRGWYMAGRRTRVVHFLVALAERPASFLAGTILTSNFPKHVVQDNIKHSWSSFNRSLSEVVFGFLPHQTIQALAVKPIIFIFGNRDEINRSARKKLQPVVSKKHKIITVDASHHIPLEDPEVIAQQVLSL